VFTLSLPTTKETFESIPPSALKTCTITLLSSGEPSIRLKSKTSIIVPLFVDYIALILPPKL
jgi:hypothetical protein